jgi:hypothetical protein
MSWTGALSSFSLTCDRASGRLRIGADHAVVSKARISHLRPLQHLPVSFTTLLGTAAVFSTTAV